MVFAPLPDPVDPGARLNYRGDGLDHLDAHVAPLDVLRSWYTDANHDARVNEPNAMVLATVDATGLPNARTVLLKGLDADGFVFYTNTESTKAAELAANPVAALVLPWHPMYRQIRARGPVEPMPTEQAVSYFQSRPRGSQVAAWASRQSKPLAHREDLQARVAECEHEFADTEVLPLPPFWGGYRVRPVAVELWVGRESRLHDRWVWTSRSGEPASLASSQQWVAGRLQP